MLGVLLRQPDVAMALHTIDQEPAARESLGCGAMGLFAFMEASAYAYRTRSIGIGHRSVSDRHLKDLVLSAAGIEEEMVWTDDPDDGVVASLSLADAEGEIAKLKSLVRRMTALTMGVRSAGKHAPYHVAPIHEISAMSSGGARLISLDD